MAESTETVTNTLNPLADSGRRYVLCYLDEQEAPVSFDRLGTRVAAWHTDSDPDATITKTRTALYACSACEMMDISEELDTCSKRGETVTKFRASVNYPPPTSRT